MCNMEIICKDIDLFEERFPNLINWRLISWNYSDGVSKEWLEQHESYRERNKDYTNFYSPQTKTIILAKISFHIDYVRFHEMGHMIHHIMFDFKRFSFPEKYKIIMSLYWGVPERRRKNHEETFADVFADTMLRFKNPNCIMFEHNKKMLSLLEKGGITNEFRDQQARIITMS